MGRTTERLLDEGALAAADEAEFWAWWRIEWPRRTWFGKLKLVVATIVFSPLIGMVSTMSYLDRRWPATYKEDADGAE